MCDKMPDSLAHSNRWKQTKITMDNDSSYINPGDFLIILSTPGETPTKILVTKKVKALHCDNGRTGNQKLSTGQYCTGGQLLLIQWW